MLRYAVCTALALSAILDLDILMPKCEKQFFFKTKQYRAMVSIDDL